MIELLAVAAILVPSDQCGAVKGREVSPGQYEKALVLDQPITVAGTAAGAPYTVTVPAGAASPRFQGDARTFIPASFSLTFADGRAVPDGVEVELVTYPTASDLVVRVGGGANYLEHDVRSAPIHLDTCRA